MNKKATRVWAVLFNSVTMEEDTSNIYLFDTKQKAMDKFGAIVADERDPNTSWVGEALLNNESETYTVEESEGRFEIWEEGSYNCKHLSVVVNELEVN